MLVLQNGPVCSVAALLLSKSIHCVTDILEYEQRKIIPFSRLDGGDEGKT